MHLLEDCYDKNGITSLMEAVIAQNNDNFKEILLSHMQDEKFSDLRRLYMHKYSIAEDSAKNVNVCGYCMDISDDDSDFTQSK